MKITASLALLLSAASAAPATISPNAEVQNRSPAETDRLLFSVSLPTFTTARNAKNPPGLDWSSDNCSWSPDNPFGFPFNPGCHRHDFGYRNYKAQGRFTDANKLSIDNNFKDDLFYQCRDQSPKTACEALANVYYTAVRNFGRSAAIPAGLKHASSGEDLSEDGAEAYNEALEVYEKEVEKAKEAGII